VLQNNANQGIKEDLCPQMTQIHADNEPGILLLPYLRVSASSAGNSGFGCGWPRWVVRGSFLSGCGWPRCVDCVFFHKFFLFFFYLHLPSFAFSSLYLPSLVKVPKGDFEGFFAGSARAACAGWSRVAV